MSLNSFQFFSHYRTLIKPLSILPPSSSLTMKDRPPAPSSVYVPPHQRLLRSVITAVPLQSGGFRSTAIDPKPIPNAQQQIQQPQHMRVMQQKRTSRFDEVLLTQEVSACDIDLTPYQGASISDNTEAWKWKLTALLRDKDKQEVFSREKKDRRDYEKIAALASKMGFYSNLYSKVVVVSKLPLPNYRFDLDDKRPQREVILPPGLPRRIDSFLGEYLSHKPRSVAVLSGSSSNGSIATDEGLFEQPELLPQSKASMENILWRRSMQMQAEQQTWQV